jgi:ComF family protein
MPLAKNIKEAITHLIFPHVCVGCGSDIISEANKLCMFCHEALPKTSYHLHSNNPIEKIFWGRLPLRHATAQYYFTKQSLMQRLMHRFKYKGDKDMGLFLGRLMGYNLNETNRFKEVDSLIPLPLFPDKERRRGYNQANLLCEGISGIIQKPVLKDVVVRRVHTESQTSKTRVERWQNIEGRFSLLNEAAIKGKHLLLVDDVITTGATLEACGLELLKGKDVTLSIATLCCASNQ